jgi:hypothetical protein
MATSVYRSGVPQVQVTAGLRVTVAILLLVSELHCAGYRNRRNNGRNDLKVKIEINAHPILLLHDSFKLLK